MTRLSAVTDKMPFMEHLGELRVRIMRSLIALLIGLAIAFPFSQRVVDWLARPIQIAPLVGSISIDSGAAFFM